MKSNETCGASIAATIIMPTTELAMPSVSPFGSHGTNRGNACYIVWEVSPPVATLHNNVGPMLDGVGSYANNRVAGTLTTVSVPRGMSGPFASSNSTCRVCYCIFLCCRSSYIKTIPAMMPLSASSLSVRPSSAERDNLPSPKGVDAEMWSCHGAAVVATLCSLGPDSSRAL